MEKGKSDKVKRRDSMKVRTRGELLAAIRDNLGLSQEELEYRSGVSKTQISRIERDITSNPSIDTIRKLEAAMDVPLLDLFLNPGEVNSENLSEVRQLGTIFSEFEKKVAREQLSADELQIVLEKAMCEIANRRAGKEANAAISGTENEKS